MAVSVESRAISVGEFYQDLHFSLANVSSDDAGDLRSLTSAMFGVRTAEVVLGDDLVKWVLQAEPSRLRRDRLDDVELAKAGVGYLARRRPLFLRAPYYDFEYTPKYLRMEFLAAQLGLIESTRSKGYLWGEELEDPTDRLADFELALAQSPQLKNITIGELLSQGKSKVAFFPLAAGLIGAGQQLTRGEVGEAMLIGLGGCGLCLVTAGTMVGATLMLEYLKEKTADPNEPPQKKSGDK